MLFQMRFQNLQNKFITSWHNSVAQEFLMSSGSLGLSYIYEI